VLGVEDALVKSSKWVTSDSSLSHARGGRRLAEDARQPQEQRRAQTTDTATTWLRVSDEMNIPTTRNDSPCRKTPRKPRERWRVRVARKKMVARMAPASTSNMTKNVLAARNLPSTMDRCDTGEVQANSSMVPARCSSAKLPMVTNGSTKSVIAPSVLMKPADQVLVHVCRPVPAPSRAGPLAVEAVEAR